MLQTSQLYAQHDYEFRSTIFAEAVYLKDELLKRLPGEPGPDQIKPFPVKAFHGSLAGPTPIADAAGYRARTPSSGQISPRPLLMINGTRDSDHVKETSVEPLYRLAQATQADPLGGYGPLVAHRGAPRRPTEVAKGELEVG